jgi:hypothetical protein
VIVILDGEFGQTRSVSPKEIIAILNRGKTVIGASSMGALRASELDRTGMIGLGWVYDHFRRSTVRRDDDVALVFSPIDFRALTVPMIDVEHWLDLALTAELIGARDKARLLRTARNIFFADRTMEALLDALRGVFDPHTIDSLLAFSGGTIPSLKNADAKLALRFAASLGQSSPLPALPQLRNQ